MPLTLWRDATERWRSRPSRYRRAASAFECPTMDPESRAKSGTRYSTRVFRPRKRDGGSGCRLLAGSCGTVTAASLSSCRRRRERRSIWFLEGNNCNCKLNEASGFRSARVRTQGYDARTSLLECRLALALPNALLQSVKHLSHLDHLVPQGCELMEGYRFEIARDDKVILEL